MELVSTSKFLITEYVDDSGLNCHRHQGGHESSKFIEIHPMAIKGEM